MTANGKVVVGYNLQIAVDAKHKLIVEQAVNNQVDGLMVIVGHRRNRRGGGGGGGGISRGETIDVVATQDIIRPRTSRPARRRG